MDDERHVSAANSTVDNWCERTKANGLLSILAVNREGVRQGWLEVRAKNVEAQEVRTSGQIDVEAGNATELKSSVARSRIAECGSIDAQGICIVVPLRGDQRARQRR